MEIGRQHWSDYMPLIIGLDQAYRKLAWAAVTRDGEVGGVGRYEMLQTNPAVRGAVEELWRYLEAVVSTYAYSRLTPQKTWEEGGYPTVLFAYEDVYLGNRGGRPLVNTHKKLAVAQGVVLAYAVSMGWRTMVVNPATWQADMMRGRGRRESRKHEHVKRASRRLASALTGADLSEDESDAVMIARSAFGIEKAKVLADAAYDREVAPLTRFAEAIKSR